METPTKRLYLFDDFCLDVTDCQLRRRGAVIALPPKVFDMLRVMVENRGRILDKDFLMKSLWPDTFVEDGTLAQYVFLLRKALNEETAEPRYIETIPRRGYRFVAQVQEVTDDEQLSLASHQTSPRNGTTSLLEARPNGFHLAPAPPARASFAQFTTNKWLWLGLGVALGLGLLAFVVQHPSPPVPTPRAMQITKLTTMGKAARPALAPDSKYVAYVVDDQGKQSIWVRQIATANEVQVTAPAELDLMGLTFAPDGNYLYYLAYGRPQVYGTLYRLPALGGTATKLIEDVDSPVAFAPDGKRLAFVRYSPLQEETYIVLANANGSEQQMLAKRRGTDAFLADDGVAWSPDGNSLACAVRGTGTNGPFINLVSLDVKTNAETVLTSKPWRHIGQMTWRKDGSGVLALARSQGAPLSTSQLWHFPFPTGEPSRITNDLNVYSSLSANAAGNQLVTIQSTRVSSFWLVPHASADRAGQVSGASTDNYAHRLGMTWTPDGRLIYGSYASGNADLWQMNADGSNPHQLTVDPNADFAPAVSSDGRQLTFVSNRGGGYGLWRMDVDGQNVQRLTAGVFDLYPTFTPDGQWVLYSDWKGELPTTWKVAASGGEPSKVLPDPAYNPAVSPDGKLLAYFQVVPQALVFKLAVIPLAGGAPSRVFEFIPQDEANLRWSPDGQMLTYIDTKNGVSNIWGQPWEGGPARQLTKFKNDRIFRFAWSPDGKTLACERGFYVNDVVLMSDFLS